MFRTYLIKATYDWIISNHLTPYLLINSTYVKDIGVPKNFVNKDGRILLDISTNAIDNFNVERDTIFFDTSFKGKLTFIKAPIESIEELYSKENDYGIYLGKLGSKIKINEGKSKKEIIGINRLTLI